MIVLFWTNDTPGKNKWIAVNYNIHNNVLGSLSTSVFPYIKENELFLIHKGYADSY